MRNYQRFPEFIEWAAGLGAKSKLPPAIVVGGEESLFKKRVLAHIEKNLSRDRQLTVLKFNGTEVDFKGLHDELFTPVFFASPGKSFKLIHILNASQLIRKQRKILLSYMQAPAKEAMLVLDSGDDRPEFDDFAEAGALLVDCAPIRESALLLSYITRLAKERGKKIQPVAATYLHSLLGFNLNKIDSQLENLVLCARGDTISADDVRRMVEKDIPRDAFDYVGAVVRRDGPAAFSSLKTLFDADSPAELILGALAWKFVTLTALRRLSDENGGKIPYAKLKRFKLPAYRIDADVRDAETRPAEAFARAQKEILRADLKIKTGATDPRSALQILTARLVSA